MSACVGLSRFDGLRWRHVVARDGYPGDMAFDAAGNLWLATTSHGALRYGGARWTRLVGTDGLVDGGVTAVASGVDDDMWFGTGEGVFRFDGATWRRFTTSDGRSADAVETIVVDDHGDVLAGTTVGLDRYDGSRWESIPRPPELSATVTAIAVDGQGGLWVAPRDEGHRTRSVAHRDADAWTVYSLDQGKCLFSGFVTAIAVAANGDVWFADTDGALRFDGSTWMRHSFHVDPTHTPLHKAWDAVAGENGEVWIGHGIGVSVFRGEAAPALTPAVTPTLLPTATPTSTEGPGPEPTPSLRACVETHIRLCPVRARAGCVRAARRDAEATPAPPVLASPHASSGSPRIWVPTQALTPRRPGPVADCVCPDVLRQVPRVVIHHALANPERYYGWRYYGWRYSLDPGKPPGPANPLRECLSLRSNSSPYHPLYNSVTWRVGCS